LSIKEPSSPAPSGYSVSYFVEEFFSSVFFIGEGSFSTVTGNELLVLLGGALVYSVYF
jgi:hypothetical protein